MSERIVNVHEEDYNGRHYRSTLEAQTAKVLDALGIPFAYEERKIELLEGFRSPFQKKKVMSITYTPDFVIGPIILECKGFETPEWKLKRKLLFKWLSENEPDAIFYQVHDARKELLAALDKHWNYLGYEIEVTSKETKKSPSQTWKFESIAEAMETLGLKGKPIGALLRSLTGKTQWVYGYSWKLIKY